MPRLSDSLKRKFIKMKTAEKHAYFYLIKTEQWPFKSPTLQVNFYFKVSS